MIAYQDISRDDAAYSGHGLCDGGDGQCGVFSGDDYEVDLGGSTCWYWQAELVW